MDKTKLPEGFYLYRENFRFGKMGGYRRARPGDPAKAEYLFGPVSVEGKRVYLSGLELYAHLEEYWRPAAREDQDYFCSKMGELRLLAAPEGWDGSEAQA